VSRASRRLTQSAQRPQSNIKVLKKPLFAVLAVLALIVVMSGCGKSGPPLPPLVKLPAAPADFTAERRGDGVDLQFTVPVANTDGTRPANVAHVDVYAITPSAGMTDDDIVKHGVRIASIDVKRPRDPDQAVHPDDPDSPVEPPEGEGLDQGATARAAERLTPEMTVPFDPATGAKRKQREAAEADEERPLLGPASLVPSRTYLAVGISTRGRKGQLSKRVVAPLLPPPDAPPAPKVTYNETAVSVTWPPATIRGLAQQPASGDVLPAQPIGMPLPTLGYHVYDVSVPEQKPGEEPPEPAAREPLGTSVKLTRTPLAEATFSDARMTWGERRCYAVRAVATIDTLTIESDATAPVCTTLKDTFPPAPPKNLQAVGLEGSIDLIWDASPERDIAGYYVLRRQLAGGSFEPVTATPIQDARFTDNVAAGTRFVYTVKAVDRAGNVSEASAPVEEAAR
jgi:hypothetical protein